MNVIFMGTPPFATTILKSLISCSKINVTSVFTQVDKKVGRKQILTPPDIKQYILENNVNIKIFQPTNLKDKEIIHEIISQKPDFIIVAAYGMIISKEILKFPCINLHASILPKYRGASPIQQSILNKDKFTAVTAMLMNEGLDTGDMLGFSYIKLEDKSLDEVTNELAEVSSKFILKILNNFNDIKPLKQFNLLNSYAKKIKKEDAKIDFFDDAEDVFAKYKAYYSWPGIFLKNNLKLLEIKHEKDINFTQKDIGRIKNITKEGVLVAFKNSAILIKKVQAPSKKPVSAIDYIRGKRLKLEDYFI